MREINILIVTDHWQGTRNKKLNWSTLVDCTQERLYYNSMKNFTQKISILAVVFMAAGCSVKQVVPDAIVYAPMDCANKVSIERFIQEQHKEEDDPRVKRHYKKVMWDLRTECGAIQQ